MSPGKKHLLRSGQKKNKVIVNSMPNQSPPVTVLKQILPSREVTTGLLQRWITNADNSKELHALFLLTLQATALSLLR